MRPSSRWRVLAALSWIETKVYLREPAAIFWSFAFPFLLLFVLTFVSKTTAAPFAQVTLRLVDQDGSELSRAYLGDVRAALVETGSPPPMVEGESGARADEGGARADEGGAPAGEVRLTIPRGFADAFAGGARAEVAVGYDFDSVAGLSLAAILEQLSDRFALRQQRLEPAARVTFVDVGGGQDGPTSDEALVAGLIGMSILSTCLFGFATVIVQLRARDSFKMLQVFPLTPMQYLAAFVVSRLAMVLVFAGVFLLVADLYLGLDVRYSPEVVTGFALYVLIGSSAFLGLSLLLAARLRSVGTANGIGNVIYFPLIFGSGVFFPVRMPWDWLDRVIAALPLAGFVRGTQAVLFQGASLPTQLGALGALALWLVGSLLLIRFLFVWHVKS